MLLTANVLCIMLLHFFPKIKKSYSTVKIMRGALIVSLSTEVFLLCWILFAQDFARKLDRQQKTSMFCKFPLQILTFYGCKQISAFLQSFTAHLGTH
jgi:hypothetical protein